MDTTTKTVRAMYLAVEAQNDDFRVHLNKHDVDPDWVAGFMTRLAAESNLAATPVLAGALTMAFGLGLEFKKIVSDPAFGLPVRNDHTDDLRGDADR
jgi:hypothetical protein